MVNAKEEKRRCPRLNLHTPIRWQIRGAPVFNSGLSNDIGLGGLSFTSSKFIAPTTPVMLEINLLSRVLRPIGRISWSTPLPHSDNQKVGVEFSWDNNTEENFLSEYINMRLGKL